LHEFDALGRPLCGFVEVTDQCPEPNALFQQSVRGCAAVIACYTREQNHVSVSFLKKYS
jgi:hypothetical protein